MVLLTYNCSLRDLTTDTSLKPCRLEAARQCTRIGTFGAHCGARPAAAAGHWLRPPGPAVGASARRSQWERARRRPQCFRGNRAPRNPKALHTQLHLLLRCGVFVVAFWVVAIDTIRQRLRSYALLDATGELYNVIPGSSDKQCHHKSQRGNQSSQTIQPGSAGSVSATTKASGLPATGRTVAAKGASRSASTAARM